MDADAIQGLQGIEMCQPVLGYPAAVNGHIAKPVHTGQVTQGLVGYALAAGYL